MTVIGWFVMSQTLLQKWVPGRSHYGGVVYLGYTAEDRDTGKEVEVFEAVSCRRCANGEEV